jgi:putative salt-induced outer membrane protein
MKKVLLSSIIIGLSISTLNATTNLTNKELIELGKEYLKIKKEKEEEKIEKEKKEKEWKIKSQIGFSKTNGNTDTTSFSGLVDISKKIDKHILSSKIEGQYSEESGIENKNKINGKLNYFYEINKQLSFNYEIYGEQDKFSGFDYKIYTGPGVMYKFDILKKHEFKIGVNVLYENDVLETVIQ